LPSSRLEGKSGRGRIFIGELTYQHLVRDDAPLAARCVPLAGQILKGIATPVTIYEVPWRLADAPPLEEEFFTPPAVEMPAFGPRSSGESTKEKAPSSVGL